MGWRLSALSSPFGCRFMQGDAKKHAGEEVKNNRGQGMRPLRELEDKERRLPIQSRATDSS